MQLAKEKRRDDYTGSARHAPRRQSNIRTSNRLTSLDLGSGIPSQAGQRWEGELDGRADCTARAASLRDPDALGCIAICEWAAPRCVRHQFQSKILARMVDIPYTPTYPALRYARQARVFFLELAAGDAMHFVQARPSAGDVFQLSLFLTSRIASLRSLTH
jgi:hypothetical protein